MPTAWDYYVRAAEKMMLGSVSEFREAFELYHRSIKLDPSFAGGYALALFCFGIGSQKRKRRKGEEMELTTYYRQIREIEARHEVVR